MPDLKVVWAARTATSTSEGEAAWQLCVGKPRAGGVWAIFALRLRGGREEKIMFLLRLQRLTDAGTDGRGRKGSLTRRICPLLLDLQLVFYVCFFISCSNLGRNGYSMMMIHTTPRCLAALCRQPT